MSGLHAQRQLQECHRQLEQNEYKMLTYFLLNMFVWNFGQYS